MLAKLARIAVAAAAATITLSAAEGTAAAAFKAVCESPVGGACTATRSSGIIECACKGDTFETTNEEIKSADDDELLDACWVAFSMFCTERTPETAQCSEPDHGDCEVSAEGWADCTCSAIGTVREEDLSDVKDLSGEALEDACYEQMDRLCIPPASPATAPIPMTPASFGEPAAGSTCSIGTEGGAAWALLVLPAIAFVRRRRRA